MLSDGLEGPSWQLHAGQLEVWNDPSRFRIVATGRRWGKTYLAACYLISSMLEVERNGRDLLPFDGYYIAPTFSQAKDIMFRLVEQLGGPWIRKSWGSSLTFEFVTGRLLQLKGADRPDRLRGVGLADAVIDEYASTRPEVWPYVVLPTMADLAPYSRAMFIGSPSGRNHFYALWSSAMEGRPGWKAWQFRTIDSPLIPNEEIENARMTLSEHAFKQEFEADFGDSADSPLNPDLIKVSSQKKFTHADRIVIGVRLQSFERKLADRFEQTKLDMTTFVVARISGDKVHVIDIDRNRYSVREMATRLLSLDRKYRPMVIAMESKQKAACESHLEEREMRFGRPLCIESISEHEASVATRCTWILQPLIESSRLTFEDSQRIDELKGQCGTFPDENADDDMIRALTYACEYIEGSDMSVVDTWEPLDSGMGI